MLEIIIAAAALLVDQGTKLLCASRMAVGEQIPIINGFFSILYSQNTGMVFGKLNQWEYARWLLLVLTILVCGGILWFCFKERKRMDMLMRVSLALILAGALGNFMDRLWLGYVRDMIYFHFFPYIFNVADSVLCVGTVLLVLDLFFGKGKRYLKDEPEES